MGRSLVGSTAGLPKEEPKSGTAAVLEDVLLSPVGVADGVDTLLSSRDAELLRLPRPRPPLPRRDPRLPRLPAGLLPRDRPWLFSGPSAVSLVGFGWRGLSTDESRERMEERKCLRLVETREATVGGSVVDGDEGGSISEDSLRRLPGSFSSSVLFGSICLLRLVVLLE